MASDAAARVRDLMGYAIFLFTERDDPGNPKSPWTKAEEDWAAAIDRFEAAAREDLGIAAGA